MKKLISIIMVVSMLWCYVPTIVVNADETTASSTRSYSSNDYETTNLEQVKFKQVSIGNGHYGAISYDNSLYMWGNNEHGQIGDGTKINCTVPVKVLDDVVSVSLGSFVSAAVTSNGDLYTWGGGSDNSLGNGSTDDSLTPQIIMTDVIEVNCGAAHGAALTKNHDLYMWGLNFFGQIGDNSDKNASVPKKVLSNVDKVSLGMFCSSAITTNGDLYTWGNNKYAQIGDGNSGIAVFVRTPKKVMSNVLCVSMGNTTTAAITKDGSLFMWGGESGTPATPKIISDTTAFNDTLSFVSLGNNHNAVINSSTQLYLWGKNDKGQLGVGDTEERNTPTLLMDNIETAYMRFNNSAAITKAGKLYVWGDNSYGQIGNEMNGMHTLPYEIIINKEFTECEVNISFRTDTNEQGILSHDFYYSDSFFENESTIYNHDLAKMTLGLVMSGFSTSESDAYWGVTSKEAENKRSANIVDAYKKLGFVVDDIQLYNYDITLNDASDKVAFSIAHKDIIVNGQKKNLVAVILRGGGYGAEWSSNFHVDNNGMFHEGFNNAATNVMSTLISYLGEHQLMSDTKIWIGGFSRAAATSNLLTAKLDKLASQGKFYSISRDDIFTYTFATPQGVVDSSETDIHNELYNNIFNIINPCDVVPTLALSKWGFGRYGQSLTLPYVYETEFDYSTFDYTRFKSFEMQRNVQKQYKNMTNSYTDAFKVSKSHVNRLSSYLYALANDTDRLVNEHYQDIFTDTLALAYYNNILKNPSNKNIENGLHQLYGDSFDYITSDDDLYVSLAALAIEDANYLVDVFPESANSIAKYTDFILAMKSIIDYYTHDVAGFTDTTIQKVFLKTIFYYFFTTFFSNVSNVGYNHYPELYLSWLEAYDIPELYGKRTYKKITASCPVNVYIYSSDGTLLASVVNGEIVEQIIPVFLNNDSKEIWLLDEDDYDIRITAYDNGTMTYSVEEYDQDFVLQDKTNFYDVEIEKNGTYETTVLVDNDVTLSSQNDTILDVNNGTTIVPSESISPSCETPYVEISVATDGNGYVYGNQTVLKGNYISVTAAPKESNVFVGWYKNDKLVSTAEEYYFSANSDMEFTAKFKEFAVLAGHNLSLDGSIGVNFFMELGEDVASNENTYMHFELPNGSQSDVPITKAIIDTQTIPGKTLYVFKCEVAAKEMTDEISAQLIVPLTSESVSTPDIPTSETSGSEVLKGKRYTYTVKQYADYLFKNVDNNSDYRKAYDLIRAMVNYGVYAQEYFDHNTENPVTTDKLSMESVTAESLAQYAKNEKQGNDNVNFEGASLELLSETTLRMYFTINNAENVSFAYNGEKLQTERTGNYYYVDLKGIQSDKLAEESIVTVTDGNDTFDVGFTPMAYCYNVISRETTPTRTEALKNLMRALVLYNQEATKYFGK